MDAEVQARFARRAALRQPRRVTCRRITSLHCLSACPPRSPTAQGHIGDQPLAEPAMKHGVIPALLYAVGLQKRMAIHLDFGWGGLREDGAGDDAAWQDADETRRGRLLNDHAGDVPYDKALLMAAELCAELRTRPSSAPIAALVPIREEWWSTEHACTHRALTHQKLLPVKLGILTSNVDRYESRAAQFWVGTRIGASALCAPLLAPITAPPAGLCVRGRIARGTHAVVHALRGQDERLRVVRLHRPPRTSILRGTALQGSAGRCGPFPYSAASPQHVAASLPYSHSIPSGTAARTRACVR